MGTYKTSGKTWLEVSVNGPWGAALQPNAPIIEEEIVKESVHCHRLGAAIIHLHAFDANGNEVNDDPDRYERMIKAIKRQAPDAIVYPTVPSKAGSELLKPEERYKVAEELGKRPGVLEWTSVDPGSCNLSRQSVVMSGRSGGVYVNPEPHTRYGLELATKYQFYPGYAIYEPGFMRLGSSLAKFYPRAPMPIYRLMFSDGMLFGFPPQPTYLEAYTHLHHQCDPYTPLMIAGLDVDIMPLIPVAIKASKEKPGVGGPIHIRVGLEDAPLGTKETNESLVRQAVEKIRAGGADVATSSEVRTDLLALGERRRDWLEEVRRKEGYKI